MKSEIMKMKSCIQYLANICEFSKVIPEVIGKLTVYLYYNNKTRSFLERVNARRWFTLNKGERNHKTDPAFDCVIRREKNCTSVGYLNFLTTFSVY